MLSRAYRHGRDENPAPLRKRHKSGPTSQDLMMQELSSSGESLMRTSVASTQPIIASVADFLGTDVTDDVFQREVVQKTQTHYIGRQEAETEVIIDKLIDRYEGKDKALLYVVSDIPTEIKVQIFVNTLLHRGANPSTCDSSWQTPLHHAVKRNFKGVCSKLLENDALPHARDKDNNMPYHLALNNNNDDIAALILNYMPNAVVRELHTAADDKGSQAECKFHTLLRNEMLQTVLGVLDCMMDPIGDSGHMRVFYHVLEADEFGRSPRHPSFGSNSKSCLHVIAKEGYKSVVYHDVVRLLIRKKWKGYARSRFQINCVLFCITLFSMTFSAISAVMTSDPTVYDSRVQLARAVFEVWSYLAVVITFFLELNQFRKHRLDYWKDKFNWIDLSSSSLLLLVPPLRFTHRQEQWHVFSVGYLLWTLRLFKYAAVFRQTGAYAQILWRIVAHDFLQFTIVFAVILLAFSGSFVMALRGENSLQVHNETSTFWDTLFTGVRILIEGESVIEYTEYSTLSCIIMVIFLFTCIVVLLNILIAQLSDTYQNVQRDAQRGLELNRAWIIARVELNSLFIGKGYRVTKYQEVEEIASPLDVLEKWENPPLNELNKYIRDIWDGLDSHKLNLLTIKNRLARQEYTLTRILEQLDRIVPPQTPTAMEPTTITLRSEDTDRIQAQMAIPRAGQHADLSGAQVDIKLE
ncbi:transient receptor potential cation channel subfamily V member 1-like isoform X2 [Haliotis asinina]|uniref:transient receptor potential cation channel subfamily V member 1-like isoform X2 n=1 Tax=Haliotis asinina TaxID=109174 RepID=UPI003531CF44